MKNLLKILLIALLVIIIVALSTAIFIGAGYVVSLCTNIDLFQAAMLSVGSTFVVAFILSLTSKRKHPFKVSEYYEEEDEDDKSNSGFDVQYEPSVSKKISRNEPCPCGSGKKYKNCCYYKEH
jgi:uncharacterized protein YchJ